MQDQVRNTRAAQVEHVSFNQKNTEENNIYRQMQLTPVMAMRPFKLDIIMEQ